MDQPERYPLAVLQSWAGNVLEKCGMPADHAADAARLILRSDLRGRATHGIARLPSYVQMIDEGLLNARPRMRHSVREGAIVFDADGALGHVAAPGIVALGLAAARTQGTALAVVRDIGHLGALGMHALAAAEAGICCMLGQQAPPVLGMPGFTRPAIGNNPLAFACPLPEGAPLVFDMACSEAARGHILLAASDGRPIPADWAVDEDGQPTTDPQRALAGALLPMGGHKGIGLAMLVEVLAAACGATAASLERPRAQARAGGGSSRVGAFFWFIDPCACATREVFDEAMRQWTGAYLASGPGVARLPGQQAAALEREARASGVPLSAATVRQLRDLGTRVNLSFTAVPLPL